MSLSRRSTQRFNTAIWPGFVDAMTGLLLVLMFVLTIFMVIQFVLREEITGQAALISEQGSELDDLAAEVASLAAALGLAQDENTSLRDTLTTAEDRIQEQDFNISRLTVTLSQTRLDLARQIDEANALRQESADTLAQLETAETAITQFESQVAGLLAERADARAQISELTAERAELLSEQDALNIALAQAREEINAETQAARLAAAQADVLETLVADLEQAAEADAATIARLRDAEASGLARISELEAAQLAEIAAAEALRDRLANADTELTAMTLALEEQRREAEETLTLLAATQSARDDLIANLAAAVLARQTAEADIEALRAELERGLSSAEAAELDNQELEARLAAALIQQQETTDSLADVQDRLAQALLAREALAARLDALDGEEAQAEIEDLRSRLVAALSERDAQQSQAERQAALLAQAESALTEEEALSIEARREVALLNQQVSALRTQVGSLQALLDVAAEADAEAQVQIAELGSQLNTAPAAFFPRSPRQRGV